MDNESNGKRGSGVSRKDKVVSSSTENKGVMLDERTKPARCRNSMDQNGTIRSSARNRKIEHGSSVASLPSRNYHKPRHSSKAAGDDELVKHMSNVPCYLQRVEGGDNVQHKALNFGVIDWGRLEKWAYDQRPAVDGRNENYKSTSNTSQVSGRTGGSRARRKGSPPLSHPDPSSSRTKMMQLDNNKHLKEPSDPTTSQTQSSVKCYRLPDMECHTDAAHSKYQPAKGRRTNNCIETISGKTVQTGDVGTSAATAKFYDVLDLAYDTVKRENTRSTKSGERHSKKQDSYSNRSSLARDSPREQIPRQNGKTLRDHLQESVSRKCSSTDTTTVVTHRPVLEHNSLAVNITPTYVQFPYLSHTTPHSCPLPSTTQSDDPTVDATSPSQFDLQTSKPKDKPGKRNKSSEKPLTNDADISVQEQVNKRPEAGRESSSHSLGANINRMKKGSSLRDISPRQQMKCTGGDPDNSHGEKATGNNKARQSPLKRMLDPLLKSKNRINFSGPIAASRKSGPNEPIATERLLQEESASRRWSFGGSISFFSSQGYEQLSSSSQVSTSTNGSLPDKKNSPSTTQALLQLTWKDGLPLFTLSFNGNNILAGTLMQKSVCDDKRNLQCIYTILSVHEVKRKSSVWIIQGKKDKKHGFVSNVVAQLKVSSSELESSDSNDAFSVKEFVLFGAELTPEAHEPVNSISNDELAAVIIKLPRENVGTCPRDVLINESYISSKQMEGKRCDRYRDRVKIRQSIGTTDLSNIVVILPGGIHGSSATGDPSPLIERWRSGGQCDCGGWDEGCALTLLTEKGHESRESHTLLADGGTNSIKLYVQGGSQDDRHLFSMVAFKEGLYMVDYEASITSLQALAVCIATLHSRKHANCSQIYESVVDTTTVEEVRSSFPSKTRDEAPTGYLPHHPPLSPVRRS